LFKSSGTFTPATGVTTVNAYIRGAGGSSNVDATSVGSGGSSSVAFAGGTVTALGGTGRVGSRGSAPAFNTGRSAANNSGDGSLSASFGGSGVVILRYADTLTITIGAGLTGTESSASGGYKRATITAGTGKVSWA
jgi:hypothetical protein